MLSSTEAIRTLIISDKGHSGRKCLSQLTSVEGSILSNWEFRLFVVVVVFFFLIRCEMASKTTLSAAAPQFYLKFQIWGRFSRLKAVWAVHRKGTEMRDGRLEVTFGSPDLKGSKSHPRTFVLRAASCSAPIKPCKHPNQGAASTHVNPPPFLPPSFFLPAV